MPWGGGSGAQGLRNMTHELRVIVCQALGAFLGLSQSSLTAIPERKQRRFLTSQGRTGGLWQNWDLKVNTESGLGAPSESQKGVQLRPDQLSLACGAWVIVLLLSLPCLGSKPGRATGRQKE